MDVGLMWVIGMSVANEVDQDDKEQMYDEWLRTNKDSLERDFLEDNVNDFDFFCREYFDTNYPNV